ncbi:MAG: TonB-dependent receptor, partial [Gammaproteobacteria bacterium]
MSSRIRIGIGSLIVACWVLASCPATAETARFDIPAGDASDTLRRLAQRLAQSKVEILYITRNVHGYQTHAVSGQLDVPAAVRQMLEGTGLEFEFENDDKFVSIKPHETLITEEFQGSRDKPALPYKADASARNARSDPSARRTYGNTVEEVVITGTLLHGGDALDIISPLTVMSRKEIRRSAYHTVQDALQTLPIAFKSQQSEDAGGTGNFARGAAINLRGLGAGATLVLIDGHRQPLAGAQGDFVDVSTIPTSAIDRIEVLPDGASALYGSDAIAGVVNIIMRKSCSCVETTGRYGSGEGGGDEKLVSQTLGANWSGGGGLVIYEYSQRSSLMAAERDYAANSDKRPLGGSDFRSSSSSPGNILDPVTLAPAYGIPSGGATSVSDLVPGTINLQNRLAPYDLLPNRRMHNVFVSGGQKVNDQLEFFMDGRFTRRDGAQQVYGYDQVLLVPATNPRAVNPYPGSPSVALGYNFIDDLGPLRVGSTVDIEGGTLGANLKVASWHLAISANRGVERLHYTVYNQPDQGQLAFALSGTNPDISFDPFQPGMNSAQALDSIRLTQPGRNASGISTGSVVGDGPLLDLPSGTARLAVGLESRSETFARLVLDRPAHYGRTVDSVFAELAVPLVGNPQDERGVPRLELSVAGRIERYSDFGDAKNPKVSLRWSPSRALKFRGSAGTSFRAPSVVLEDTSANYSALAVFPDTKSPSGRSVILGRGGVSPDLKKETARTTTFGVDIAPSSTAALSLTYYDVSYQGRITQPGPPLPTDILLQEAQWSSVIERNPARPQIEAICGGSDFVGPISQCLTAPIAAVIDFRVKNLASTRARGIDLQAKRWAETRIGRLAFALNGGYILSFEQAISKSMPASDVVDTVGNPLSLRLHATGEWFQHGPELPGFGMT